MKWFWSVAVPDQSSLLTALNKQNEQEAATCSTSEQTQPLNPNLQGHNAETSKTEDDEVAEINKNCDSESASGSANQNQAEAANQSSATLKSVNQDSSSVTQDSNEIVKDLDVSETQSPVRESPENTDNVLEVEGVKIRMDLKEPTGSLYSINPFVIPTVYLKPFERHPEPIAKLSNDKLDKILVQQKARKGAGPMPHSKCADLKTERKK